MMGTLIQRELAKLRASSLARNAGWMLAGQGASLVFQTIYFVVLARLLGTAEYGIYAGAFSLVTIVSQYSALGSGTVFLRYVSADAKQFGIYWGNILLTTIGLGLLSVLILQATARYLVSPPSASLILLAGMSVSVCGQVAVCAAQVFQTFEKMRFTAILNLLTNLVRCLTAVLLYVFWRHVTAWQWTAASLAVSAVAAAVAIGVVVRNFGAPRFEFGLLRRRAAEGLGYSFASSTASAYNDIDKTMLSHYGMNEANGIYTMAYRVVDIASIPILSLRDAAVPRFFRLGADGIAGASELSWTLMKRAVPVALACAAVLVIAAPVIPILVGHGFDQSVAALRWLALIPVFRAIHQMTGSALLGAGYQRYRTTMQLCAAALNFGLNLVMIPAYGWLGAAWASLVTDGSLGVMNWCTLKFLCAREIRKRREEKELCIAESSFR